MIDTFNFTPEDVEKAVSSAEEALDKCGPENWRERIDLATLNMDSPWSCVLAQVYMDEKPNHHYSPYYTGVDALVSRMNGAFTPSQYGFDGNIRWLRACEDEWRLRLTTVTVPEREEC